VKRGNIGFQASHKMGHLHCGRYFTHPDVRARFQFVEMPLYTKTRLFHEIGREKSVDGCHNPGMGFDIAIAEPEFGDGEVVLWVHCRHCSNISIVLATLSERPGPMIMADSSFQWDHQVGSRAHNWGPWAVGF